MGRSKFPAKGANAPKIAVVSHAMFLKVLTSKEEYWSEKFVNTPDEAQKMPDEDHSTLMMNCEIKALKDNIIRYKHPDGSRNN